MQAGAGSFGQRPPKSQHQKHGSARHEDPNHLVRMHLINVSQPLPPPPRPRQLCHETGRAQCPASQLHLPGRPPQTPPPPRPRSPYQGTQTCTGPHRSLPFAAAGGAAPLFPPPGGPRPARGSQPRTSRQPFSTSLLSSSGA